MQLAIDETTWVQLLTAARSYRADQNPIEDNSVSEMKLMRGQPIARLAFLDPHMGIVCLPIPRGRSSIGSSAQLEYSTAQRALRGVVEGHQWIVQAGSEFVTFADDKSTSGSFLLVGSEMVADRTITLSELGDRRIPIGWDGKERHMHPQPLSDGDIVFNAYRTFVFSMISGTPIPKLAGA